MLSLKSRHIQIKQSVRYFTTICEAMNHLRTFSKIKPRIQLMTTRMSKKFWLIVGIFVCCNLLLNYNEFTSWTNTLFINEYTSTTQCISTSDLFCRTMKRRNTCRDDALLTERTDGQKCGYKHKNGPNGTKRRTYVQREKRQTFWLPCEIRRLDAS